MWRTDHPDLLIKLRNDDREAVLDRLGRVKRLPLHGMDVARPQALVTGEVGAGFVMELERDLLPLESLLEVAVTDVVGWWRASGGTERRLRVLASAFAVLAQAHRRGLVIGDVSPRNFLIDRASTGATVVLIDPDGIHYADDPPPGPIVASVPHVAPEVFNRTAAHGARTDTFAAALIAAHVMLLHHPFRGAAVAEGTSEMEFKVYRGELPWCYDRHDPSNPRPARRAILGTSSGRSWRGCSDDASGPVETTPASDPPRRRSRTRCIGLLTAADGVRSVAMVVPGAGASPAVARCRRR